MDERFRYSWSPFWRVIFFVTAFLCLFYGFIFDGIKFFGVTTDRGAFKPIKVDVYEACLDRSLRYRWKIKYEFYVGYDKYVGSKYVRGPENNLQYNKVIGYLSSYPKINWLENGEPKGIDFLISLFLFQFFIWLSFKKRLIYGHELDRQINGVYFSNTGLLPVKNLNTKKYIAFLYEELKLGIGRVFTFRVALLVFYLCLIWLGIVWAKENTSQKALFTVLSTLTYANGGLHGNLIFVLSGLLGKMLMASYFIFPVIETSMETNYLSGYPAKSYDTYSLMSSFGAWLCGFAISLVSFYAMTAGLCYEDSIIGLILALYCFKAQKNLNNPVIGFFNSFENGKPRNEDAGRKVIVGAGFGFFISFILIWTEYSNYISYSTAFPILLVGLTFVYIGKAINSTNKNEVRSL